MVTATMKLFCPLMRAADALFVKIHDEKWTLFHDPWHGGYRLARGHRAGARLFAAEVSLGKQTIFPVVEQNLLHHAMIFPTNYWRHGAVEGDERLRGY